MAALFDSLLDAACPITLALFLSGCAGELAGDEQAYLSLTDDGGAMGAASIEDPAEPGCPGVAVIFEDNCSSGICHDAEDPASGLDLASPGVEERLIDGISSCGGRSLVDSLDPADSYLLEKLGPLAPECGSSMPLGGRLTSDDFACVEQWVESIGGSNMTGDSDGGQP